MYFSFYLVERINFVTVFHGCRLNWESRSFLYFDLYLSLFLTSCLYELFAIVYCIASLLSGGGLLGTGGHLQSPIGIFRSAPPPPSIKSLHFVLPTIAFIAFFCSLFDLILKSFPSGMQNTFSKHYLNPSLLSAILNLYYKYLPSF